MVSGTGHIRDVVNAPRLGAWHYIIKPVEDLKILLHYVKNSLKKTRLIRENRAYQEHLEREVEKRTTELVNIGNRLNEAITERPTG